MSTFAVVVSISYVLMVIAQSFGPEVIELLHDAEARLKATAPQYDDVKADTPLEQLCQGYDDHHFDSLSNCLHAAGMLLTLLSIFSFCLTRQFKILTPELWNLDPITMTIDSSELILPFGVIKNSLLTT